MMTPRLLEIRRSVPTILLAEDDEAIAGTLAKAMRRQGYEVFAAADGAMALHLLDQRSGRFDLVLLDVLMPGADGVTVLRRLRRTSRALHRDDRVDRDLDSKSVAF